VLLPSWVENNKWDEKKGVDMKEKVGAGKDGKGKFKNRKGKYRTWEYWQKDTW
jgi:hypothetical protein